MGFDRYRRIELALLTATLWIGAVRHGHEVAANGCGDLPYTHFAWLCRAQ
jgi:hypothetical protein